jgi:hypothetical protein
MCALAVALMTAGAVAEVFGVGLVVFDIRSAVKRARQFDSQPFEQALPLTPVVGRSSILGGEDATLTPEERIERLEREVATQGQWTENRIGELRDRMSSVAMEVAERKMDDHLLEERVRGFFREILTADIRRRTAGVVLIVFGIGLALAGNLVGLAAC